MGIKDITVRCMFLFKRHRVIYAFVGAVASYLVYAGGAGTELFTLFLKRYRFFMLLLIEAVWNQKIFDLHSY